MSYFENVNTREQDSPDIDAFGRKRVSQVTTQIDLKQLHDKLPLFIDEETSGGTATHSTTNAETALEVTNNADFVIMQTKQRFNYQSGKSQLMLLTFNSFDNQADTTKRIGYFSSNTTTPFNSTLDGIFLQSDGTNISVNVYRSGTAVSSVNRSAWDDPLDGSGASGITHDFDNNTILGIDFEWLGVGRIRFFVVKDGVITIFHTIEYTETTTVYMSSPNQPLRWECRANANTGGTGFNFICSTVSSEGSINQLGRILSDNLGVSTVNANSTSNVYALLGIQLQSAKVDTLVDILDFSVLATTTDNVLVQVFLNPTVAGTFNYSAVTNSGVAIAKGDTSGNPSTNTVTGGTLLYSRVVAAQSSVPIEIENAIRLGMAIDGTLDSIVITARPFTSNCDVTGTIGWRELS